ncbi:MAG: acetyltransferase [Hyphomicrobiales bacterium]
MFTDPPVWMMRRTAVISEQDAAHEHQDLPFVPCAFNPRRREELSKRAIKIGLSLSPAVIDPSAIVARSSQIGELSYLNAGVVIGGATVVGSNVLINRSTSAGHHCFLSDGASLGPGVTLASNVHVGSSAMIGAGATILPDTKIGDGAVVSAGALVRKNVPEGAVVAGAPASIQRKIDAKKVLSRTDQE